MLTNNQFSIPTEIKKIKERIKRYEKALQNEKEEKGYINDGFGKRYILGPFYLLADDLEGSLDFYRWFEDNFADDRGEPFQYLCWALALYKSSQLKKARKKIIQTIFMNLYLIPYVLDIEVKNYDIWYSSNLSEKEYIEYMPVEYTALWDDEALDWLESIYLNKKIQKNIQKYISIYKKLKDMRPDNERSKLIDEAREIENVDY